MSYNCSLAPIIDPAAMNGVGGVTPEKMFEILYRNGAFWNILMITAALLVNKNIRAETLKYRKIYEIDKDTGIYRSHAGL